MNAIRVLVPAAAFLLLSTRPAAIPWGQDQIGTPTPTALAKVKIPEDKEWALSGEGVPVGYVVRTPKGLKLLLAMGREFPLEGPGIVRVAEQTGSFVVLTPLQEEAARDWALDFFDESGRRLARVEDVHGYSLVGISAGGETVVVAGTLKAAKQDPRSPADAGLVVYDGGGKETGRSLLPPGTPVSALSVDPTGQVIAFAFETRERNRPGWEIRLLDRAGTIIGEIALIEPVQSLRLNADERTLLVLVPGGVRVFGFDGKLMIDKVRLPEGYVVPGAGRMLMLKGGTLLAVAERPGLRDGKSAWVLLRAEPKSAEFRIAAKGGVVMSRQSPTLNVSRAAGAALGPALFTPLQVTPIKLAVPRP